MLPKVDKIGEAEDAHPSKVLAWLCRLEAEVHPPFRLQLALELCAEAARPQPTKHLLMRRDTSVVRRALEGMEAFEGVDLRDPRGIVAAQVRAQHLNELGGFSSHARQGWLAMQLDA